MPDRLVLSLVTVILGVSVCAAAGCGASNASGSGGGSGNGGSGSTGPGDTSDAGPSDITMPAPGQMFQGNTVPASAGLPPLPLMPHVAAVVHGNSAEISFDPVPGAIDYRVYLLPTASDVRLKSDGSFDGVNNATYRCAGKRDAPPVWVDYSQGPAFAGNTMGVPNWVSVDTQVVGKGATGTSHAIHGYTRTGADTTLGYGFGDATPDTVPIYAVGDPNPRADNYGYGIREAQTRAKLYVKDKSTYLAGGWRDDGVSFYAPASATSKACGSAAPVPVYTKDYITTKDLSHVYYVAGPEASSRGTATTAFYLCPTQATGSLPVMRVYYFIASPGGSYGNFGDSGHDEVVLGQDRFDRARCQGATFGPCTKASQSLWQVHWANVTGPTQLVVEALDAGCPFQGLLGGAPLAATAVSVDDNNGNTALKNDPLFSFAQLQAAAPNGEVFLNGQWDGSPTPHPIARASLQLTPEVRPAMDFASDFANKPETFSEVLNANGSPNCGITHALASEAMTSDVGCDTAHRMSSPTYDVMFDDIDKTRFSIGQTQGELWTGYSGGKFRITPKNVTATMSDTTFIHAAMEVSSFSTGRRYPQILISEQDMVTTDFLLDRAMGTSNTNIGAVVVLNPIDSGVGRHVLELELCYHRPWQVNNHCPWFLLEEQTHPTASTIGKWTSRPDLFDKFQDDRSSRYDLYLSTKKAYVYLDSVPYGCVDLAHHATTDPSGATITPVPTPPKPGPVTVTFGDVQYHAGAESGYFNIYSPFHLGHMLYETVRHFDYVGFKSGESAPGWDETVMPCVTQMHQGGGAGTQTPEQ